MSPQKLHWIKAQLGQRVYKYRTIKSISLLLSIPYRPNGGIRVSGLRIVASQICSRRLSASGKRAFIPTSGGPILPGCLPSAIKWQARQLPLLFSITSAFPFANWSDKTASDIAVSRTIRPVKTNPVLILFSLPGVDISLLSSAITLKRRIIDGIYSLYAWCTVNHFLHWYPA